MRHSNFATSSMLILGFSVLTTGCATTAPTTPSTSAAFGEAVRHNIAAQSVEPTQEQKQDRFIPADPDRRRLALERYKADAVEEPEPVNTSEE